MPVSDVSFGYLSFSGVSSSVISLCCCFSTLGIELSCVSMLSTRSNLSDLLLSFGVRRLQLNIYLNIYNINE